MLPNNSRRAANVPVQNRAKSSNVVAKKDKDEKNRLKNEKHKQRKEFVRFEHISVSNPKGP